MRNLATDQTDGSTKKPNNQQDSEWGAVPRLLPYLWRYKTRVIIAMGLLFAAKAANVGLPLILKDIVDSLDASKTSMALVLPLSLLIAYGILRLGSTLFGELRDVVFGKVTEQAMRNVALTVFKHLHALDLAFHLQRRTGGLSRDIERGLNGISFLLRFMLFNILPTLLEIGLVAAILFANYHPIYAIIVLVSVVSYIAFSITATEWRTRFVRQANQLDSKANVKAVDSLLNFETVKYFNNEDFEAKRYDTALESWTAAQAKSRLSGASLNSGQAIIIALSSSTMMILAAQDVVAGNMTLGDLVLINAYIVQLFVPLNFLGFVYREIKRSLADMARMFSLLDKHATVKDKPGANPIQVTAAAIKFTNIDFGYHADRQILNKLNIDIDAGQTVAIVGTSGAGKSTIARLLFRFYDINSGQLTIDGQDIRNVTQQSLRQHIGVVPQDTVLFNDSIYYNIWYGRPDASEAEVKEAARLAHLSDFIESLPDGYDTTVGERGLKLSGGEKQRIAIARALLKNPEILIFDEATSALDSRSEQAILQAFREVSENRTTLVIAHRLSTIVDADKIVVLDKGAVVEQGSHTELLGLGGVYAGMWALQQKTSTS